MSTTSRESRLNQAAEGALTPRWELTATTALSSCKPGLNENSHDAGCVDLRHVFFVGNWITHSKNYLCFSVYDRSLYAGSTSTPILRTGDLHLPSSKARTTDPDPVVADAVAAASARGASDAASTRPAAPACAVTRQPPSQRPSVPWPSTGTQWSQSCCLWQGWQLPRAAGPGLAAHGSVR